MENIIKTNNPNLRLAAMSVGVLSTLRVSLPLVPADATNVEIIVTAGTTHNAYAAAYDSLCNVWTCDIAASQFPETGKQRYEVAYKLGGKQFWDGSGWITVESATTGGLTPVPQPDPPRYVVTTINGYGAPDADGAVRIPKLFFGTESPITTEGYIEGDQFFDRITGSLWTLCEVVGEFVWIVCQTGGAMKRSEFAGLDENESSLQDVIRLLRDGVLGVLLVSFLALFNSSALGAVDVKTARLGTLPAKATVVTNIVGAVDSDEALGIATNAIPSWARSETKPTYTAAEVGARPDDWMPTAAEVGAVAKQANGGVAIGVDTTALGVYSHAEGRGTTASGVYSHAEGRGTTASGDFSHAEGYYTKASGNASHAEGVYAKANENYSFSWNGDQSITYDSHGTGTFNLNPLGGLSGLWIGGSNLETILGGYAKRTGETETIDFRNTRTMVKTQLAPVGEDAVNFDMLVRAVDASSIATTYAPTNALVSLNQSVQYVTADSNGASVEILAPTNSMKDWVVYIYTTTNNAVLFPTGTVYAVDSTVTNALKPNVVTALYLSSYPAVTNGLIVGRQEMNPIVISR